MGSAYVERLINQWAFYYHSEQPVPVDLTVELLAAGVDVSSLETETLNNTGN